MPTATTTKTWTSASPASSYWLTTSAWAWCTPRRVGELAALLRAEQSLLSPHLRVLRDARIVTAERNGKSVLYRLASGVLARHRAAAKLNLGCCRLAFD